MSDLIARGMAVKVSEQLADNTTKLGDLTQLNTTDKSSVVNALKEIKSQASSNATAVSNIGNGSPKGTYATLSALQTAYPTGTTGVYIVTADGGWYYWNGSAWTKGGTYQSTGIGANSITPDLISNVIPNTPNLFNSQTVKTGYFLDGTGVDSPLSGYAISDYIPVSFGVIYQYNSINNSNVPPVHQGGYYDVNKIWLAEIPTKSTMPANFTPPANAKYVRINTGDQKFASTYVNSTASQLYSLPWLQLNVNSVKPSMIQNTIDVNANLFNTSSVTNGYYLDATGTQQALSGWDISGFIPVNAGETYQYKVLDAGGQPPLHQGAYYDSNQHWLGELPYSSVMPATWTAPANAAFVRLNTYGSYLNNSYINSTKSNMYELPWLNVATSNYETKSVTLDKLADSVINAISTGNTQPSKWSGKKWSVIGDSITAGFDSVTNTNDCVAYHQVIANKIGCTVNNYGIGGTGYRCPSSVGGTDMFYNRLSAIDSTSDLITVFGGTNDWNGNNGVPMVLGVMGDTSPSASFYGAVDNVLSTLVTNFPTKTIAVFTPLERSNAWYNLGGSNGVTLQQVTDAVIAVANKYNIPVLDLYRNSNMYAWNATFRSAMMPDGLHPNNTGHQALADKILAFLNML